MHSSKYYYVGGMPEAVQSFVADKDFNEVRKIQKRILEAYEQDFSKHATVEIVPKIRMIWNSKKIRSSSTVLYVRVDGQSTMKRPLCDSAIAGLSTRSAG